MSEAFADELGRWEHCFIQSNDSMKRPYLAQPEEKVSDKTRIFSSQ